MQPQILFKDYVALMYHEARNVRHLIRESHFDISGWEKIVSLPTNRIKAWKEVEQFAASVGEDAEDTLENFEQRYGKSINELVTMFENPNWKHAAVYGGNAWARIGKKVVALSVAIRNDDSQKASELEQHLLTESHNTGTVVEKLKSLRMAVY